ncbi:hypothetical protein HBN76_14470 [Pseudomonas sp. WS 5013]|uniref:hypothetical protein n=1 Tax=Pseudomonas sp. WS 5013 TaxID=2717475 RepID=UPI0014745D86|nr:hypothetical protein [Pseudomonas sp. WS 5013]NMY42523.1 hypothetical protein [Pseudomonas sp. WS 5013]
METLKEYLSKLERTEAIHIHKAQELLEAYGRKFYPLDLLFLAAINRSRSYTGAFLELMKKENYLAAAPMIRQQVDSILRLSASRLVKNPHEFAQRVLAGEAIRKIKDMHGNKMTDAYLLTTFKHENPWIEGVYSAGSGFIHLSEKHIFGILTDINDDGVFNICISEKQSFIPEGNRIEAVEAFYQSVMSIFELCDGWIFTKNNPQLISEIGNIT